MGKNDFLTPKAIANRIKAKGLQKLRWYCQMCQKQCRDENGFKCHCMSESHQRQMQVFGQNPTRIVDGYSEEFESTFLDHVRRAHRFSRVAATVVYNEYIADRHHIHMNSTKWITLTEFVKYLGRTGKCKVEETPKGWFMTYIDRDSETIFKDRLKNKRLKADLVEEEKQELIIARQIERAREAAGQSSEGETPPAPSSNSPDALPEGKPESSTSASASGKVAFALAGPSTKLATGASGSQTPALADGSKSQLGDDSGSKSQLGDDSGFEKDSRSKRAKMSSGNNGSNGLSTLDELMKEEEKAKERSNRKDYWLCEGIVVKVMSKALAEKGYYKQKGVVVKVIDKYVGEIEMLEKKHVLRVDQDELETVIPQIGGLVRIVNGAYRGSNARLLAVNTEKFCAEVRIEKGIYDGRVLRAVDYEDICKLTQ